ncbi:T6SS immunity protein Tli4 family protein [Moellerella wisconsensis]|uniref:T6SS immunity protein Tli4 family protein n=1 Tax=Moellerella wisconsensis TaxID=158849 RepID=UPI001F4E1F7B|nr:T6SS immunity protein Tli4 family protein [Moellerella wisconsensis]UNH26583.1 T6SS immunity protein Tli4 family protein [Moellerella wisconsensis]
MKNKFIGFLGLVLLAALAACSVPNKTYSTSLNDKDSAVINTLFDDAPTYCLGRYTFNYPKALTQELSSIVKIDDMTIESQFIYPPSFKQRIELREEELKNKRVIDSSDAPFLKEVIKLDNGVIFDSNENSTTPDFGRILEGHVYIDNVAFIIKTEIRDVSNPKYKNMQIRDQKYSIPITDKPQKLAAMQSLISRLHGRPKNEIPTEKGMCIPYGFIRDDGQEHKFKLSMLFKNSQFAWAIVMDNLLGSEDDSLLERSSEVKPIMRQLGASTLKKGTVHYNNLAGEEWLISGVEDGDKKYRFQYNANEKNVTYLQPLVLILLHNSGILTVKDYTDEQMVEIWDRVLQSFKVRPNAY